MAKAHCTQCNACGDPEDEQVFETWSPVAYVLTDGGWRAAGPICPAHGDRFRLVPIAEEYTLSLTDVGRAAAENLDRPPG